MARRREESKILWGLRRFSPVFTAPSAASFVTLVAAWLQCLGRPAIRRLLAVLDGAVKSMSRIGNVRAQVEALLKDCETPRASTKRVQRRIAELEEKRRNWDAAIERGYNTDGAIGRLNELDCELAGLKRELVIADTRERFDTDEQAVSQEILANLERLEEVLAQGSVAEVKAILRACIGRIDYGPGKHKARIGFLRLPTRALVSRLVPENARIGVVAGARFEAEKTIVSLNVEFAFGQDRAEHRTWPRSPHTGFRRQHHQVALV